MRPTFITRKVLDSGYSRTIGADNSHLKLSIYQAGNTKLRMDGIGFSMGLRYPKIATGVPFDIVYTIEENKWNGNVTLQLNIKDIRFAHKPREK